MTYSLALLVATTGYYLAVLGPMWARSEGTIRELRKLEQELQALGRARQELGSATEARDAARRRYEQVAARVLRADDLPRAVGFVQQLAEARNLQVVNVRHTLQGPAAAATAARLDVDLQGPYGGVLALAEALEAHFPAIEFVGLVLEASAPQSQAVRSPSGEGAPGSPRVRAALSFTVPLRPPSEGSGDLAVAWVAPAVSAVRLPRDNPFQPALPLAALAEPQPEAVVQALEARVTGVALGSEGPLAILRLANRSHVVRPGDRVGPLRVLRVEAVGVIAELDGRQLQIPLR